MGTSHMENVWHETARHGRTEGGIHGSAVLLHVPEVHWLQAPVFLPSGLVSDVAFSCHDPSLSSQYCFPLFDSFIINIIIIIVVITMIMLITLII